MWSVYLLLHWGAIDDVVAVDVAAGLPPMMAVDLTRWRGVGTGWAFTYFFVNFITFWFLMAVCFVPFIKIGFTPGECQCVFQCVCVCKLEQLPRLLLKDPINKHTHTQAARLAQQRGGRCKWMLFPFILCLSLYFFQEEIRVLIAPNISLASNIFVITPAGSTLSELRPLQWWIGSSK